MTTELLGVIQEIVKNYVNAIKMTDKATGTVIKTSPLTIQTDTSLPPISGNSLILTSNVIERTEQVKGGAGGTVTVTEGLKVGDKVLLLRVQKGSSLLYYQRSHKEVIMAVLPEGVGLDVTLHHVEKPTRTFLIDWSSKQVAGMDEGLPAMRQAVEIILQNERFRWQIYSSDFGSELESLVGEERDYIESELPRRIEDAFSGDSRILAVENFVFTEKVPGELSCSFDVKTVYGTLTEEVSV